MNRGRDGGKKREASITRSTDLTSRRIVIMMMMIMIMMMMMTMIMMTIIMMITTITMTMTTTTRRRRKTVVMMIRGRTMIMRRKKQKKRKRRERKAGRRSEKIRKVYATTKTKATASTKTIHLTLFSDLINFVVVLCSVTTWNVLMSRVLEDEGKPPYLYWMRVMQMLAKIQQNLWHPRGDVVRKGLDTTC